MDKNLVVSLDEIKGKRQHVQLDSAGVTVKDYGATKW